MSLSPGGQLDGTRLNADLAFPVNVKHALTNWRVGFPITTIEDKLVQIVQRTAAGGTRIKMFFEVQIDYADYVEVPGIKMPFHWTISWTDGRSSIQPSQMYPSETISLHSLRPEW